MKCPKCGYLGFETTDRCRNCGYDFSLAAPSPSVELPLRAAPVDEPLGDLDLREGEGADDAPPHERESAGFGGRRAPRRPTPPARSAAAPVVTTTAAADAAASDDAPAVDTDPESDLPLFAPRPAGTPLAVRRQGHEVARSRRTTTRPVRMETGALPLSPEAPAASPVTARAGRHRAPEAAGLGARLAAAVIDLGLLLVIDVLVIWLTLRIAGLSPTAEDLRVIRPVPMLAFLLVLAFLYLTGFTVGGGQTIGKMLMGIRVAVDDGRGVDMTGAVVRALGCIAAVATLGLLFVPALVTADRRAVHDRLAGTRVVTG
jgi:uncharacterized RDD family membrane protein YckC